MNTRKKSIKNKDLGLRGRRDVTLWLDGAATLPKWWHFLYSRMLSEWQAYYPSGKPELIYCAWNADTKQEALYRLDPTDLTVTQDAFNAQRRRLHEKINATHFAFLVPLENKGSECVQGVATFAQSNEAGIALFTQTCCDAKGHTFTSYEMHKLHGGFDGEHLIKSYFDEREADAAPYPSWNYIPGNN